jgi:voltage-gated potassium channel
MSALRASRPKITVFLGAVLTLVLIVGALMHLIEGPENGFTSIPKSVYWAIVTLTTVGYGNITPQTILGQSLASMVMILGYGIIAVPTGIVSVEISKAVSSSDSIAAGIAQAKCPGDHAPANHDADARYCKYCGHKLASTN